MTDMAKRASPEQGRVVLFGDAAWTIELTLLVLLDAVASEAPHVAHAMIAQLDALLAKRLPTPGAQAGLTALRSHIAGMLAASGGGGLPN